MRLTTCLLVVVVACMAGSCNNHQPLAGLHTQPNDDTQSAAQESPPFSSALPSPSELRNVSWEVGDRLTYGVLYSHELPSAGVTTDTTPWAYFTSQYQLQLSPAFDDVAYAVYRCNVPEGTDPVLCTSWEVPPGPLGCYVGLANYAKDSWDWYACTGEDISLPPLAPYLADNDWLTLAICVLEEGPLTFKWFRVGPDLPPEAILGAPFSYIDPESTALITLAQSSDPEYNITLYELDADGDGTYDYSSPDDPDFEHDYPPGIYDAVGRVTDGAGQSATDELTIYVSAFDTEQVDIATSCPSLDIGLLDVPRIAYGGGEDNAVLKLAVPDGETWSVNDLETVAGQQDIETGMMIEPGTGAEIIAYGRTELHIGRNEGAIWNSILLDDLKGWGKPALAYDGDGYINVFHAHKVGEPPVQISRFYRTRETAAIWVMEELSAYEPSGRFCAADYEGYLAAAYSTDEVGYPGLLYLGIHNTISGWNWSTVAEDLNLNHGQMALEISPIDHQPRLAYISDPEGQGQQLMATYAWFEDDAWQFRQLEPYSTHCDLALDAAGNPHVVAAYRNILQSSYTLWYHWSDGSAWHRGYVTRTGGGGELDYLALKLDSSDKAHICWTFKPTGQADSELWYAAEVY